MQRTYKYMIGPHRVCYFNGILQEPNKLDLLVSATYV